MGGRLLEEQRFTGAVDASPDETTAYEYDDLGRRVEVNEYNGASTGTAVRTTTYDYDPVTGQQAQVASPEGTINYEYDPATGRHTRTYTTNNDTTYDYDGFGRLWHVTAVKLNGQTLSTPNVITYMYDAVGNLDYSINDNGTATTTDDLKHDYGYDDLNRLTSTTVTRGATTIFSQTYLLAADGQRESSTETVNSVTTFTDWEYDAWNRLKSEFRDVGNGSSGNPDGPNKNLPNSTGDYYTTYTFDPVGNRLTKAVNDHDNNKDETITSRYVFASGDTIDGVAIDSGLIGKVSGNDWLLGTTTTLGSGSTTRYEYNQNGSTIGTYTGSASVKYKWDLRNRMTGYDANGDGDTSDNGDINYSYDEDGNRVSTVVVSGTSTYYLIDKNNPTGYAKGTEEKSSPNGSPVRSYVLGLDIIAQADATNGTLHFLKDGHGRTRALVSSSGIAQRYDFDAYGNKVKYIDGSGNDLSGDPLTTWLMPDGYRDFATKLDRNGVRDVASWLGQFMTTDPGWELVSDPASPATLHRYLYANANPVYYIDPSGTISIAELKLFALTLTVRALTYVAPVLYLGHRITQQVTSSGLVQRLQETLRTGISGVYPIFGRNANMMRLDAGKAMERIVNPAMRLLNAQSQVWIRNPAGQARADWILFQRHLVDAKLGQFISQRQFQVFLREASRLRGSVVYICLTAPPPATVQAMTAAGQSQGARVFFIVLTPL